MAPAEFFAEVYPKALLVTLSPKRAFYATVQAANESGYISANSVAANQNNLFGITCSNFNPDGFQGCQNGFRVYNSYTQSIGDWKALMKQAYERAYYADTVSSFANNIAYSPYITSEDNRPVYKSNLISIAETLRPFEVNFWISVIVIAALITFVLYKLFS